MFDAALQEFQTARVEKQIISNQSNQTVIGLEPNQPQYRILVVDDKFYNRELLLELLKPIGFAVKEAEDGEKAIALWQDWQPDLILMDIRMPNMDGNTAIEYIKSDGSSHTKIIALTASAMEEEKSIILAQGCDDFLRKPFQVDHLFSLMTKHLGVCYTYAEAISPLESEAQLSQIDINSFNTLSNELLLELQQSIMAIDLDKINHIIEKIGQENQLLAKKINQHISNFEYEYILKLLPN